MKSCQIHITRTPHAVARAVARSCVDVSRLQPKLLRALLSLLILQVLEKLGCAASDFGELEGFQIATTPMPQTVAQKVAHNCVVVSRLQPRLLRALWSILRSEMLEKTLIFRFRFWKPEKVLNPHRAHASSSCARGCAQLCGRCVHTCVAQQGAARGKRKPE